MHRHRLAVGALTALAAGYALVACGGSSSPSSSNGTSTSTSSSTSSSGSISVGGGSFCDQTRSVVAQVGQLAHSLTPSPGATPDISGFKQLLGTVTSAIDTLDGSAPSDISSAFHTFRSAYDQANSQVQSATTFQQMGTAFSSIDTASVKAADSQITAYLQHTCGINPSASP